ncbi:hypothetical protein OS188_13305 [Xanthomarina sp. F1114]|uniref:hypothetical protein n=1 Tax=Xanthomarina sp. F1114 TaxID=2996019 RepID=UPI00225E6EBD|nr:hypothetical protein [Xanthomarina sp. F1114]MCX7548929.1 hypothetical protein [Xanthomarina sp. F1114]
MKTRKYVAMAAIAALFAFGCSSDDDNNTPDPEPPANYDVIVGKWRAPVPAPILASFVDSLHVEFKNNQTYLVKTYKDGAESELAGTYATSNGAGDIRNIVLEQSSPTTLTSEGIYKVNGAELTYEVAQTQPAQSGVTAPTAEAGFGSTSDGAFGMMNVQDYVKMN